MCLDCNDAHAFQQLMNLQIAVKLLYNITWKKKIWMKKDLLYQKIEKVIDSFDLSNIDINIRVNFGDVI